MIAGLINNAWSVSMRNADKAFRLALRRPGNTQRQRLRSIITHNADTAFGRDHQFDQIDSVEDFRRRVPLGDYNTHQPYIERIQAGESNVLTTAAVTHLIPTSGSSGARKLIPHTRTLQAQFDAALGPWVRDLFRRHPGAAKGRAYWSVSPAIPSDEHALVPIGFQDDTDYLSPVGRLLVRRILAVPATVRHIADTDAFWHATALHLLAAEDLSLISIWHPSYLARLLDEIASRWADLLDELPRRRASRLRQTIPDAFAEIWPRLSLVSMWADASAALPFDRVRQRMPGIAFQAKGLLATEGWTTIPYRGQHPLAVTAHVFEFIDDNNEPRLCDELNEGQTYQTVLTTAGGLYRYRTGDRVLVTGMMDATPTLRFVGRDHSTSDLCGEKLHESHVTQCLANIYKETGYRPNDQLLTPQDTCAPTKYRLLLSSPTPPPDQFAALLDDALGTNPHYALARKLGQLDHAEVLWQPEPFRQLDASPPAPMGSLKPKVLDSPAVTSLS